MHRFARARVRAFVHNIAKYNTEHASTTFDVIFMQEMFLLRVLGCFVYGRVWREYMIKELARLGYIYAAECSLVRVCFFMFYFLFLFCFCFVSCCVVGIFITCVGRVRVWMRVA
jgi:hypothetical protein